MTTEEMLGAVGGVVDGRSILSPTIAFKVVKLNSDETVWAHSYQIIDGCLQFVTMKAKDVDVPGKDGAIVKRTAVFPTYPRALAAGQWLDVVEVFIPPANASAIAN